MRSIKPALVTVVVACLGLMLCRGASTTQGAGERHSFALAINTFGTQFRPGEPVPVIVALGSARAEAARIDRFDFGVRLRDARGDPVPPRGPVYTPPPPPGEYYMQIAEEQVYVVPVEKVEGRAAISRVVPDGLERYQPLEPGTYTVAAATDIAEYAVESLITRDELPHKTWARPEAATSRFRLESNPVTIEIVE